MLESLRSATRAALRPALRALTAVTFFLIAACGVSDAFGEGFNQGMAEEAHETLNSADRLLAASAPSPEREEFVSIAQALRAGLDEGTLDTMAVSFSGGMIEGAARDGVLTAQELHAARSHLPEGLEVP